jgi:hypothetical protein
MTRTIARLRGLYDRLIFSDLETRRDIEDVRAQVGDLQAREVRRLPATAFDEAEFKVFSQSGEDGLIQFLIAHVPIEDDVFVEFGVESYVESNTRFLLVHDNWRGVIIDGGDEHFVHRGGLAMTHELTMVTAFLDTGNIDEIIGGAGVSGDIGLVSIDVDGVDVWLLDALTVVQPRILIVEYNSIFGSEAAVAVPYKRDFDRREAHHSLLYAGSSLAAIERVAAGKGYALVGSNRAGNNAFFVRRDVLGAIPERSVREAWRPSRFRESRDTAGELTLIGPHEERLRVIAHMSVWDFDLEREITIGERFSVNR